MAAENGGGMVVAGSPAAARAGAAILAEGGNAADAAIATAVALCVTDPANATIAGRAQILLRDAAGAVRAIDGSTLVPPCLPAGAAPVPLPGLPAALDRLQEEHGRLPWSRLIAPAIALAEDGFAVPPQLALAWRNQAGRLAREPAAARFFLDGAGRAPAAGSLFRQPALARLLAGMASGGIPALADRLHRSPRPNGVCWPRTAPIARRPPAGEVLHARGFGHDLATVGRQGWGHALLLLLALLEAVEIGADPEDPAALGRLARCVLWTVHDRQQAAPREHPDTGPEALEALLSEDHLARRVADVHHGRVPPPPPQPEDEIAQDTSHLSVIDAEGNAVAMSLSAGPHFGARIADPIHGFLYPLSYRMQAKPGLPGPDWTEMTPALAWSADGSLVAAGAAGSERIPVATGLVLWHRLACDLPLAEALAAPRLVVHGGTLRLWMAAPARLRHGLHVPGWPVATAGPGIVDHCGIVHAAERDARGRTHGAADAAYDGSAAAAEPG